LRDKKKFGRCQFYQHITHAFCGNIFCAKKLQSQNLTREKLHKVLLYKKRTHKMLMKLTPGLNLDCGNIMLYCFPSLPSLPSWLSLLSLPSFPSWGQIKQHLICIFFANNLSTKFDIQTVRKEKLHKTLSYENLFCQQSFSKILIQIVREQKLRKKLLNEKVAL